jgi:methylaspartate mutase epsilon subunit
VLDSWITGAEVRDTDVAANHRVPAQNLHHVISRRQAHAYAPLLQPRTGVAHVEDEIAILQLLEANGMDVSSIQLDAASRKNMYAQAAEGVRRSEHGTSFLNGYPVPVHGVSGVRRILEGTITPFQIRAGSPDHRLVYEIALAGGASSLEGGFICYLFPYDKSTSPVANLANWKYVDKLTGMYRQRHGVTVNREYFGPLTTSLIEPSIPICINIIQAVLSAKSGCGCISVGVAEQGNRAQDIAAIRVIDLLTRRYLAKYGHHGTTVSTVYHHYMAAFPAEPEKARQVILNSSTTGTLARASRFLIKTPVESYRIPAKEDNAHALNLTKEGVYWASDVAPDHEAVQREMYILEKEIVAMLTAVERLGQGSLARGAIRAFQEGILDIPFAPSRYNRNQLVTARDCDGAVRFTNPERLPFDDEVRDFHLERIQRRMTQERRTKISELVGADLTRIWQGDFVTWPLDGTYVT